MGLRSIQTAVGYIPDVNAIVATLGTTYPVRSVIIAVLNLQLSRNRVDFSSQAAYVVSSDTMIAGHQGGGF